MKQTGVVLLVIVLCCTLGAFAQKLPGSGNATATTKAAPPQNWITPATSVARAEDAGVRAHTNYVLAKGVDGMAARPETLGVTPNVSTVTHYETPSSMACVYKIPSNGNTSGCVPAHVAGSGGPQKGGWGAIAIVDAFDNPYAATELNTFTSFYGLPAADFTKVYANGNGSCTTPPVNTGWGLEISLDVQWAHVMAPKAKIILVEACSNSYTDLMYAEYVAAQLVDAAGGGDITNSWGSGEFSGETGYDPYFGFYFPFNISYFASAGDAGCGAQYPSSSPWVISAGGTTVNRLATNLHFKSESCWAGSGGGTSAVETYQTTFAGGAYTGPWANYQYGIFGQGARSTPDIAFNADPNSGVVVYDCAYYSGTCYFLIVGGTSASSPALAGIINNANNRLGVGHINGTTGNGFYTAEENNMLYSQLGTQTAYSKNFYDVKAGTNGCSVDKDWDYCTGVGTPRGLLGK